MLYKTRKASLKAISTPQIIPESELGAISHCKSGMTRKYPPTHPNILPKPHPIRPKWINKTPPTQALPNFESTTLHYASLSCT
jgi:hypothetical protein